MRKLGSRYELLGQGTTGQVWRGVRVQDDAAVAIKALRRELADDPEIVDRFLREWDLLVELDSPGLVAVRDLVNEPGALAIVMDLVEGPDLRAHLREFGPRPAQEAVRLAIGTLWALDSVHSAGIVHRDVKPENILIDTSVPDRPIVRLTDFGIARVISTPSRVSATGPIGTPLYMAPELGTGAPRPRQPTSTRRGWCSTSSSPDRRRSTRRIPRICCGRIGRTTHSRSPECPHRCGTCSPACSPNPQGSGRQASPTPPTTSATRSRQACAVPRRSRGMSRPPTSPRRPAPTTAGSASGQQRQPAPDGRPGLRRAPGRPRPRAPVAGTISSTPRSRAV